MEEFWLSLLHAFSSATHEQDSDEAATLSSGTQILESFADEEILLSASVLDLHMISSDTPEWDWENKTKKAEEQEKWDFGHDRCSYKKIIEKKKWTPTTIQKHQNDMEPPKAKEGLEIMSIRI